MKFESIGRAIAAGSMAALLSAAVPAFAQPSGEIFPTVTNLKINGDSIAESDYSDFFKPYSGTTPVGGGKINDSVLYYIQENIADDPLTTSTNEKVQSWYIFFDPACKGVVEADITFTSAITGVYTKRDDLKATDGIFGIDLTGNSHKDYLTRRFTGTEKRDVTTWDGEKLHISWKAGSPGDHIRVTTEMTSQTPEPGTYAMLLAGLGVVCFVVRRRTLSALA
jgi:PEP-CTERM motif